MNGFAMMAEAKMRQWEMDKKEGTVQPASEKQRIFVGSVESFEKQLYEDIKRLIAQSHREKSIIREETLREAEKMEVQLLARLERSGYYHLTKYLSDEIRKLRAGGSATSR